MCTLRFIYVYFTSPNFYYFSMLQDESENLKLIHGSYKGIKVTQVGKF